MCKTLYYIESIYIAFEYLRMLYRSEMLDDNYLDTYRIESAKEYEKEKNYDYL